MEAGGTPITGDDGDRDPRWQWPEHDPDTVVELRVHGIGGEGPQGMTRDQHPVQVGGDADGVGFWRARNPQVRPPAPLGARGHRPDRPRWIREVVSWGGSTSGHSRSALWVLLLPFALLNAAGRMGPTDASRRRARAHLAVTRVLALSLTLAVVAIASGIAFDLLGLQCAASEACREAPVTGRSLLAPLRWLHDDAAALLALLAVVVAAVPFGLRFAGRHQLGVDGSPATGRGTDGSAPAPLLDDEAMWANRWPAWRLRGLHISAGYAWVTYVLGSLLPTALGDGARSVAWTTTLSVVTLVVCAAAVWTSAVVGTAPRPGLGRVVMALRWSSLAPLALLVGVGLATAVPSDRSRLADAVLFALGAAGIALVGLAARRTVAVREEDTPRPSGPSGTLRDVALLAGGAAAVFVTEALGFTSIGGGSSVAAERLVTTVDAEFRLPMVGDVLDGRLASAAYGPVWGLVIAQGLLLLGLVWTSRGEGTRRRGRPPLPLATVPGNLTAPVVAFITVLLASSVGAGIHSFVLNWLGSRAPVPTDAASGEDPRSAVELVLPWWYELTALVFVGTLVVAAVVAWVWWRLIEKEMAPTDDDVVEALGRSAAGYPSSGGSPRLIERVRELWLHQALVRRAGRALGWVVLTVVLITAVVVLLVGAIHRDGLGRLVAGGYPLGAVTLALVTLIPPGFVGVLRTAREDRLVRRQIGTLWDVLCFWPRITHPFAPPSYGEAVVPALVRRINAYDETTPVVLAGHSQGSVIAVAAAVHPALRPRPLHLVTYGSPVSLLYEGFFPTVFGSTDDVAGAIEVATPGSGRSPVDSWHNVLTPTEPISTALFSWSVTGPVADPQEGRGWPLTLQLPWRRCPICGYSADRLPTAGPWPPSNPASPERPAIDVTVTDPDRVIGPDEQPDGLARGHSSYHRSRELDRHLAAIVSDLT